MVERVGIAEHGAYAIKMPVFVQTGAARRSGRAGPGAARAGWIGCARQEKVALGAQGGVTVHGLAAQNTILCGGQMVTITDWSHGPAFKSLLQCRITRFRRALGFFWHVTCLLA